MRLALTPGEPAGIGPDLAIKIAFEKLPAEVVAVADKQLLQQRAEQLKRKLQLIDADLTKQPAVHHPGILPVLHTPLQAPVIPGQLDQRNAEYVLETLRIASKGCMAQQFHGLVTGPVHKGVINQAGVAFSGHTEFLAQLTQAPLPVMMLVAGDLRVALVTTHLPLSQVAKAITATKLEQTIQILHRDLQNRFGIRAPRIVVCGLNPHAGEGGHLGREEIEVITPTLQRLRHRGLNLVGPLPADTVFIPKYLAQADAVLAMYHDQGLPVLKHAGFGHAVNVTLGLSIVRTSVDHGTALNLAGTGDAEIGSMIAAINMATELAT